MEETESMEIQISSSDVMGEIHSELPDHIIHCILEFLPCIKDLVRTSVISKTWLQAYRTFPRLQFDLDDFLSCSSNISGEEIESKSKQFIGLVENRLQEFRRQNGGDGNGNMMKLFGLRTVSEMAHRHANRWVGMALDCKIEHLSLSILQLDDSLQLPCLIPERVLSAHWLKSLMLFGPTIYIPLTESSHVDLRSLTYLHIQNSDIIDEQLQKLLSGCTALEYIVLRECDSLYKVDIFHHPNLETLVIAPSMTRANLAAIEVRAPKLKSFSYTVVDLDRHGFIMPDVVVKIHNSPELKILKICDWNKNDEWFHKFMAQFPMIEKLTIDTCSGLKKIRISNPLLEELKISSCSLEDVVISSKMLASFFLSTEPSSMLHTSIQMKMDNPLNNCTAKISFPAIFRCHLMMEASWYCKLKEFLTRQLTFKCLIITMKSLTAPDGDMTRENIYKKLPPAACNIEKLRLKVSAHSSCHSHILNGLLSTCHPTTILLDVISNNPFVKSVCEELGNRENKRKCCCKEGEFKCWKHQLKGVKIEKIKGIKLEKGLDWNALFDLLPTLEVGNDIYFKLMW